MPYRFWGLPDMLIAATAINHELELYALNTKDLSLFLSLTYITSNNKCRISSATPSKLSNLKSQLETLKHIYFVAETKGSMSSMELRKIEDCKI